MQLIKVLYLWIHGKHGTKSIQIRESDITPEDQAIPQACAPRTVPRAVSTVISTSMIFFHVCFEIFIIQCFLVVRQLIIPHVNNIMR